MGVSRPPHRPRVISAVSLRAPGLDLSAFSPSLRVALRAAVDTLVPASAGEASAPGFFERSATQLGVDRAIEAVVDEHLGERARAEFVALLRTMERPAANLLLGEGAVRFSRLDPDARTRYLIGWRDSRLAAKRSGFQALKRLTCFLYYSMGSPGRPNPNWEALGYSGALPEPAPPDPVAPGLRPWVPEGPTELTADVGVIGTGAGGSVAASELSRAGLKVVALDAGELWDRSRLVPNEAVMTATAFEGGGTLATDDLGVQLLAGRGAGGGTFVNWMTCMRPPRPVLREWEQVHGIPGLTGTEFHADIDRVWETLEATRDEGPGNANNEALRRGAEALGYREGADYLRVFRNAVDCRGRCDFCGFGCPYGAKRSTVRNYLPDAEAHGARLLFRTAVDELEIAAGRVRAVRATYRAHDGRRFPVRVRCRAVVVAAGALGTPALLLRSGVPGARIGRGLRLHPTTAVAGEFDQEIRPWAGPPQTIAVTRFLDLEGSGHGFWMEAAPAHPGLFALAMPWSDGVGHKRAMAQRYRRSTASIVLLRERSAGRVTLDADGRPRVAYRLLPEDQREMLRGIAETGRLLAAAGARGLSTLHADPMEVRGRDGRLGPAELREFAEGLRSRGAGPNRLVLFSAHLMGSCPMGADPRRAAVGPDGAVFGTEGLYVADGSVFPSAPAVNPMITIMAMARRTSRYVRSWLESTAG